ncbi:MAG: DUF2182 domain-containing protein [Chloroflexota bacterium]|nr:DUF2182 domain-containing protein [Chloroflexota bacterium]
MFSNAIGGRRAGEPMERGQLVLLALLALLTVGAWTLTVHQARTMDMPMGIIARGAAEPQEQPQEQPAGGGMEAMPGMDSMPGMAMNEPAPDSMGQVAVSGMSGMADEGWSWDGFVAFLIAWAVMMAAMMFPAAAPMLLLFRRVSAQCRARGMAFVPTWIFAAGYLLVWAAVGGLTWLLVQLGSDVAGRLGEAERATWAPLALGATLVVAGLYQFTPLKFACLGHCQSPFGFVMTHWRDGYVGALRMGITLGAFCLGCCWALFAVLVAAGVMSLAWMLLLTLVVFAEKILPLGRRAVQITGAAFLLLGLLVAVGATRFPWLA